MVGFMKNLQEIKSDYEFKVITRVLNSFTMIGMEIFFPWMAFIQGFH